MPAMHVFTYGSLMFDPVWGAVVAGDYRNAVAEVRGFARRCIKGEIYPALVAADATDSVRGRVYFHIQAADLIRLDRFEGNGYRRATVRVALLQGGDVEAQVYVFKDRYKGRLEARDWDVAWFEREGMARFLSGYRGFTRR